MTTKPGQDGYIQKGASFHKLTSFLSRGVVDDFNFFFKICKFRTQTTSCLKYIIPKEILIVFYNGSNYDYHFTLKEIAKELER